MTTTQLSHPIELDDSPLGSTMRSPFRRGKSGLLYTTVLLLVGCGSDDGPASTTSGGNDSVGGNSASNSAAGGIAGSVGGGSVGGSPNVGGVTSTNASLGGSSMLGNLGGNSGVGVTVGGSSTVTATVGGSSAVNTSAGGNSAGGSGAACCTLSTPCNACLTPVVTASMMPPCENLTGKDQIYGIANKDLCKAVLTCVMDSKCFDWEGTWTTSRCYCGTSDTTAGKSCLVKGDANGPCRQQIEQGMGTEDPAAILLGGLTDPDLPAGMALKIVQQAADECTMECPEFLSASYYTSGTGGTAGTGGASGVGGANGSGGASGAGGGAGGTGGSVGTGVGGSTSGGGTSTDPCAILDGDTVLFDFLSSASGLLVDTDANNTSSSLNLTYTPEGTAQFSSADADAGSELVDVVSWDEAIGAPSPGSALLEVPFSAKYQLLGVESAFSTPLNLEDKTLFACARLDKGLYPSADFITGKCSEIRLIVADSKGNKSLAAYDLCPGDTGSWKQLRLKVKQTTVTDPNTGTVSVQFDSTQIVSVTIRVGTLTWQVPDALPQTAMLHLDSIGYR